MAIKLGVGVYFVDFAGGQGGGAADYVNYASDLDINFIAIQGSVNALIDEVQALQGPNAALILDLLKKDDPDNLGVAPPAPPPFLPEPDQGVIGEHSYRVSIETTTSLRAEKGSAFRGGQRVSSVGDFVLPAAGILTGATTAGVAVDQNGTPFLFDTAVTTPNFVVATVAWNGTIFTGSVTQVASIFFDGDEYAQMLARPLAGPWAQKDFRLVARRIGALERATGGHNTDLDGDPAGPIAIPGGSASTPGLVPGDGNGTFDAGTGFYRISANILGFAAGTAAIFRFLSSGIRTIDGAAGTPPYSGTAATNSGLFFVSGQAALASSGTELFRGTASPNAQILAADGSTGNPIYSYQSDADTGIRRNGADTLEIITGGTARAVFDSQGNLDLPTNTGAIVRRAAVQSISDATLTSISWDTEDRDIGGLITVTSTDLTIPTGGDGIYLVELEVEFAANTTGERDIQINVGATVFARVRANPLDAGATNMATSAILSLAATDVVTGRVLQNSTGALDVTGRLAIQKIA